MLVVKHMDARLIERELNAAQARIAELESELAKLRDPVAVHINMLRGTIATPSRELMEHVWGGSLDSTPSLPIGTLTDPPDSGTVPLG